MIDAADLFYKKATSNFGGSLLFKEGDISCRAAETPIKPITNNEQPTTNNLQPIMDNFGTLLDGFTAFLRLERGLSEHSIAAYRHDLVKLNDYLQVHFPEVAVDALTHQHCEQFLMYLHGLGISTNSQARLLSGLKTFYKFLLIEEHLEHNPLQLVDSPRWFRPIPDVLTVEEIELLVAHIDHSTPEGLRTRAIVETLYGCGLRVSELTGLQLSNLFFEVGLILGGGQRQQRATGSHQSGGYPAHWLLPNGGAGAIRSEENGGGYFVSQPPRRWLNAGKRFYNH